MCHRVDFINKYIYILYFCSWWYIIKLSTEGRVKLIDCALGRLKMHRLGRRRNDIKGDLEVMCNANMRISQNKLAHQEQQMEWST